MKLEKRQRSRNGLIPAAPLPQNVAWEAGSSEAEDLKLEKR
ncbi:hypothetical protein [Paenibacillus sp. M-152]|nr:hypothetical protein [Paenibacillus sp. M-152]